MLPCERYQQQWLPLIYDLLDRSEQQELTAHLESCAACQEALTRARQEQGLFAEAVQQTHADVVFKAPVKVSPASTQPTVVLTPPAPPALRLPFILNRWAIAAAILFLLFSGGGVLGWNAWKEKSQQLETGQVQLARAKEALKLSATELEEQKKHAQMEIRAIQEQIDTLFQNWQKQEDKTRKVVKQLGALRISGPQVAQAGAVNNYGIQWNRRNDTIARNHVTDVVGAMQDPKQDPKQESQKDFPGGLPVQVSAINQMNNKVVFKKQIRLQENDTTNIALPQDLPIHPGDQLALEFQMQDEDGKMVHLRENLQVVFPEYVTHLTTDRPMYRPGDTLRFRSLTLERFSLKPAQDTFHLLYRILGPSEVELFRQEIASQLVAGAQRQALVGLHGQPIHGLGVGEFTLPDHLPAGQYQLIVSEVNERFHEEKRPFLVQRSQAPRFNKELQFHRLSYSAGDQVRVNLRFVPLQGLPGGQNVNPLTVRVNLDGNVLTQLNINTDAEGRASVEFSLPAQILKGVGTITVETTDGRQRESIVRALPLVVRDLQVEFFPEGGELIAGVPNRVYFQVRTPSGKPAGLMGRVLDDKNQSLAQIQTLADEREPGINQGMGVFTLTPLANRFYHLHVDAPIGIERHFRLPTVKSKGVALHLEQGVVDKEIPLTLYGGDRARDLMIGAYCRGRLLDHAFVTSVPRKTTQVTLKPRANAGGVYRITVFEKLSDGDNANYRPLAERLIYRRNPEKVDVTIHSDKKTYAPGEPVELTLEARSEKKELIPTLATIAVVDSHVLKLADDKTARDLPTHFLLTTELRNPEDLENADVLLGSHPQAAQALDLLLGCQGWRRFAEQDPQKFQRGQASGKMPVFLTNANTVPQFLDSEQKLIEKVDQEYVSKALELQKKLADKERQEEAPTPLQKTIETRQAEMQANLNQLMEVEAQLQDTFLFLVQFGLGGLLLILLLIAFYLLSVGLQRLSEGRPARTWFTFGFALLVFLFLASIIGTFALMGENIEGLRRHFDNRQIKMAQVPVAMNKDEIRPLQDPLPEPVLKEEPVEGEPDRMPNANPAADMKKGDDAQGNIAVENAAQEINPKLAQQQEMLLMLDRFQFGELNAERQEKNAELQERFLRQQGNYQAILQRHLNRRVQLPPAQDVGVVRIYAHQHRPQPDEQRADLAETLYWNPVLVLEEGRQKIRFDLSDSVTRVEVLVLSHTLDGRLGANRIDLSARLPFSIEPKMPAEVTSDDQITIPVAITNARSAPISMTLSARTKGVQVQDNPERGLNLEADQHSLELFHIKPTIVQGNASVRFVSKTKNQGDAVERRMQVVPNGFLRTGSVSGILENTQEQEITLPGTWIPGTLQFQADFYPSPLAELQQNLEALPRAPMGCFEQSASALAMHLLVLDTLQKSNQAHPPLEKRARQWLTTHVPRLHAFECADTVHPDQKRGFGWFENEPPDDAMTAHGLLLLQELAKFHRIDPDWIRRHEKYLLDRLDPAGGLRPAAQKRERFDHAPAAITSAYVVWALTQTDVKNDLLDKEMARQLELTHQHKDPYFITLVAMSHWQRKKIPEGFALLKQVAGYQHENGRVDGAKSSITGSQGRDLQIETTALAMLGWLQANRVNEFRANLQNAYHWLGKQRQADGNFGSTQATLLTLKALSVYRQKVLPPLQGGQVQMLVPSAQVLPVRDEPINTNLKIIMPVEDNGSLEPYRALFAPRSPDPITLTLRNTSVLRPGKNTIQLSVANNNSLPYRLTWSCRTLKSANDPRAPVELTTRLSNEQAKEGETIRLHATVHNVSGKDQGLTMAVIGLPAGLSLPENASQLTNAKQQKGALPGKIRAWEVRGRELVLYWRDLARDAKAEIEIDLTCRIPGLYHGSASRASLGYDEEYPFWAEPLHLRILEAQK